jgi:hypothetical protein
VCGVLAPLLPPALLAGPLLAKPPLLVLLLSKGL